MENEGTVSIGFLWYSAARMWRSVYLDLLFLDSSWVIFWQKWEA
ncbi:MAG TPA: hypothetical protein VLH85_01775 [Levilinea sp.]|nr:hypothetical protein [Levilinea sp.]